MSGIITNKEIDALLWLPAGEVVVFDIGCAYGCYIEEVLKRNKTCHIHAFEPIPSIYEHTRGRYSGVENITINNCLLSDRQGEVPFFVIDSDNKSMEGCSSMVLRDEFIKRDWDYRRITARADTLDNYVASKGITHIDWMKIDTEGAEALVLKGGTGLFATRAVDVVQFEYSDTFRDMGFSIYDMQTEGYVLCDFVDGWFVRKEWVNDYAFNNYYLIKEEPL